MSAGGTTLADIQSADWSLALDSTEGGASGSGLGNVVQGVDDVAQCIAIIFSTPLGSDILRPDFGADLWHYIDRPINQSLPAIVRDVTDALERWEPRVDLISVSATKVIDGSEQSGAKLNLTIVWQLKLTAAPAQTTSVKIGSLNKAFINA